MRLALIEDYNDYLIWELEDYQNQYIIGKDDGTGDDLYLGKMELSFADRPPLYRHAQYEFHEHVKRVRAQIGWVPSMFYATTLTGLETVNNLIAVFRAMPENWHVRDLS